MTGDLLYEHHQQRNRREEKRRFMLFVAAQCVHYGALFLFLLGGLFLIVLGLKVLF